MATRKYVRRTIQEKRRIVDKYVQLPPMSLEAAGRLLNVSAPLLRTWLRKWNIKRKLAVFPSHKMPRLEAALWGWIDASLNNGIIATDLMISKKAKQVAAEMGLSKFSASPEWLTRFKSREATIRERFQVERKDEPKLKPKKNLRATNTHRIEAALWQWIDHSRKNGTDVNESTIRLKAARFARMVGFRSFRASAVWFKRFKSRERAIRAAFHIDRSNRPEELKSHKKTVAPRKTFISTKTRQLESALWQWIDRSRARGITVNDSMIHSEATRLARVIGFSTFRSTEAWFMRFKTREKTVREMLQLDQCAENPPNEQTEHESESNNTSVIQQCDDVSETDQSTDECDSASSSSSSSDLDIPQLEPTVVSAELRGDVHTVTVPSLWQMKEAMKTLATGLLYRGFCDFKLLHQFEKEVEGVLRRSVTQETQNSSQA